MIPKTLALLLAVGLGFPGITQGKPKFTVEALKEMPPADVVSEATRGRLTKNGHRILDRKGKPYIDLWLTTCAATVKPKGELGLNFSQFGEGTLLGVVRYHRKTEDFRGQRCAPGFYTCRYVIQPEDGDHQGASDSRDFLALVNAKADTTPEAKSVKELVKLSKKVVASGHPAILYLAEFSEKGEELPRLVEDENAELWLFECVVPVCTVAETTAPDDAKASVPNDGPKDAGAGDGKKKAKGEQPLRLWIVIDGIAAE
jgi:hypothetical protein